MGNSENTRIILFLGSGASQFSGYRTFESFPDLLFQENIRDEENLPPLHLTTRDFLKEIEQQLKIDHRPTTHDNFLWKLTNYKALWETLSVDGVLESRFLKGTNLWGDFSYFSHITSSAIDDITATTIHHYSANRVEKARGNDLIHNAMKSVISLYEKIAKQNNQDHPYLPVFTTNYDMLIEDLHSEFYGRNSNFQLINGIPECRQEGAYWRAVDNYDANTQRGICLYRIHGCVCWYYYAFGDEHVYFHRRDCLEQNTKNLCAMFPGREIHTGLDPHGYSYKQLFRMLLTCCVIIFIGFSFRDKDVKTLLLSANALRIKPIKLLVIDPMLHVTDIEASFHQTAKEMHFDSKTPTSNEIGVLNIRFGLSEADNKMIMSRLRSLISQCQDL